MRKYSFSYLAQRSFHSLVRNGFMTLASVLILSSCLLVTGSFGLLIYNLYVNLNDLDGLNEIVCMCDYDLPDGEEKRIEEAIRGLNNVESVTFISKEVAFEEQKKQYASFPAILDYFENKNSNADKETETATQTQPADTDVPAEDIPTVTVNGKKLVADAISKRENYKSYTYSSSIIMKMLENEISIDGVEKLICDGKNTQFLSESHLGGQLADAKYYKDGILYLGGEIPSCGELSAEDFYTLDYAELQKMNWLADFSEYTVLETDDGYAVTMNGILPETIIDAFDLESVLPTEESPKVSGYATVAIDENGNIVNEVFNIKITVSADGVQFETEIKYSSEITDIDSLVDVSFDEAVLANYQQTDNILSLIPEEDFKEEETPSDTDAVTDALTEENIATENTVESGTVAEDTDVVTEQSGTVVYADKNPLSDAFKVVYKDINGITELRDRLSAIDGIRSVKDAADAARTLQNLKDTIMIIFLVFMVVLVFISVVIIMNTVSIAISTREKEILVMRYVGATSFFISFPFLLESVIIGLISTAVAYFVQYVVYGYLCSILMNSGQEVSTFLSIAPFSEIWLPTLIGYLIIALLTCVIGSKISLAKNVKV